MMMRIGCLVVLATCAMSQEDRFWAAGEADFRAAVVVLGGSVAPLQEPAVATALARMATEEPFAPGKKETRASWSGLSALAQTMRNNPALDPAHDGQHAAALKAACVAHSQAAVAQTAAMAVGKGSMNALDEVAWIHRGARLDYAMGMVIFRRRFSTTLAALADRGHQQHPAVVYFQDLLTQREAAWWDWCLAVPTEQHPEQAASLPRAHVDVDELERMIWTEDAVTALPVDHPLAAMLRLNAAAAWTQALHAWAGPATWPSGHAGPKTPLPQLIPLASEQVDRYINDMIHRVLLPLQRRHELQARIQKEEPGLEVWLESPALAQAWTTLDGELRTLAACDRTNTSAWDARQPFFTPAYVRWGVEMDMIECNLTLERALLKVAESRKALLRQEGLVLMERLRQAKNLAASGPAITSVDVSHEPARADLDAIELEATTRSALEDALGNLDRAVKVKP